MSFTRISGFYFISSVDTSLIILSKGEGNVTDITHATFNPRYVFNFSEAMRVCQILGGSMASFDQMQVAWEAGFQKCRFVIFCYDCVNDWLSPLSLVWQA